MVQLSRRFLEGLAVRHLPPRTVSKLLKEAHLSARRKVLRHSFISGLPCLRRAEAMAGTAFRAHLIVSASDFGVKVAVVTWRLLRRRDGPPRLRTWVHHTTYLLVRAAASSAGAAAGAAAVMLILPAGHPKLAQWSVLVGGLVGDLLGTSVVGRLDSGLDLGMA